jgi:hypothetical protein
VEPLRVEVEVGRVVLLADDEPGDAVAKGGVQLRHDLGAWTVGGDDVLRPVDDFLAAADAARLHDARPRRGSRCRGTRSARDLGAALLHDVVIGELAIDVRRRPGMNGIGSCRPLGNRKLTPVTHFGAWKRVVGRLAEILAQEGVAARREDAGADLVARQLFVSM